MNKDQQLFTRLKPDDIAQNDIDINGIDVDKRFPITRAQAIGPFYSLVYIDIGPYKGNPSADGNILSWDKKITRLQALSTSYRDQN